MRVAFRAVRSRRKFNKSRQIMRQMEQHLDTEVKKHFIAEFDRRVVNWTHQPTFKARKFITADSISVNVFPSGDNKKYWIWNDLGTRRHPIPTSGPKLLAFTLGYKPKTSPVGKFGGPGTSNGPSMVRFTQVDHPGTKPRKHTETIRKDNESWYSTSMENAWRRAIRSV